MESHGQSPPQQYELVVDIYFTNGMHTAFGAAEFDVNLGQAQAYDRPHRFTYKGPSGDEHLVYLTPAQVAGIVLREHK
jgi:hypothetical protein